MLRPFLAIALAGCSSATPTPKPTPTPTAPKLDPAIAELVGDVGPKLRAVARLDLKERSVGAQLENLETALTLMGGKRPADCHVSLAALRVAVGEPLRIAAEIDGDIDLTRLPCLLGDHLFAQLGEMGLLVTDRKGGLRITRDSSPGTPRRSVVDRCMGPSCLAVEVGPLDHGVSFSITFDNGNRFRLGGIDAARLIAAVEGLKEPKLDVLTLRVDHGDLVGELRRDMTDATWAAIFKDKIAEAFKIPSSSMQPTLDVGDHIFVVKGALAGPIVPGDLVVYRNVEDRTYIKRVVAIGGQTIAETAAGISVDGVALPITVVEEHHKFGEDDPERHQHVDHVGALVRETIGKHSYLTLRTGPPREEKSWTVPPGELFMLGDNRNNSNDSRYQGTTKTSAVIGRAAAIWLAWRDGAPDWERMGTAVD